MMILSIDLMGGQAVQLRQGKERVLTAERDPVALAREFHRYGEVAVIDLDAALGQGDNLELIRRICREVPVRVGGGVRDARRAQELLRAGAQRVIIGTAAEPELLSHLPRERVMVAIDHWEGQVVDKGWTRTTGENFLERAARLAPHCGSFLCTFVRDEGGMGGMDLAEMAAIRAACPRPVTFAGGMASTQEAIQAFRQGFDVQVGMALYTGKLDPVAALVESLGFGKSPLIPTVVQDTAGQVLMMAYSSPESLTQALQQGKGVYYSRSRQALWEKGATSGHTQTLLACRTDCDRDALLFTVAQSGGACHTEAYSCFGSEFREPAFRLPRLFEVLRQRKTDLPEGSYTAKLFQNRPLLLKKIMEEAFEATQAAPDRRELVWEISDAIFFLSMLAVDEGIGWHEIEAELGGRHR